MLSKIQVAPPILRPDDKELDVAHGFGRRPGRRRHKISVEDVAEMNPKLHIREAK